MKILYIITKSNWGGAQRHVFDLAVGMKGKGHEVKVALGGEGLLKVRLEEAAIFTYPIGQLGRDISVAGDSASLKEIFSIIRNWKPDVLHLHSPKAAGLGSFAGRLLRIRKIFVTVHGWTWNEDRPFFQRAGIVFFSWLTAMLAHRTIVISKRDHVQARQLPGIKSKLIFIPPGIRASALVSVEGAKHFMARAAGLTAAEYGKRLVFGTIAELHPNKGLSYLIEAFSSVVKQYPQALWILIGDGQERAALEAMIAERGLTKNACFAGYVENAAEYLKAFNIFALPSIKEGLPYVLIEAGAASLPVVSTTVGGIPDIIGDMESGILVQPRNARELAHGLLFMAEHPDERRKYGAALKEKVVSQFSLDAMIAKTEEAYSK